MTLNGNDNDRDEALLDAVLNGYYASGGADGPSERARLILSNPDLAADLTAYFQDADRIEGMTDAMRAVRSISSERGVIDDTFIDPIASLEFSHPDDGAATIADGAIRREQDEMHVVDPAVDGDAIGADRGDIVNVDAPTVVPGASTILTEESFMRLQPRGRFGDYVLLEWLGQGGVGVVYKARQLGANRLVALKMLRQDRIGSSTDSIRFSNEPLAVASLDHPNITPIYEVGVNRGRRFFSMKFVEGGNLSKRIGEYRHNNNKTIDLIAAIADAVQHAHDRGVLHRDLKPSNILLDLDGTPYVSDFGLSKRIAFDSDLTLTGEPMGTPQYMAPEQARGDRGAITTATDVYGLGAILYELLTGRPPFFEETVAATIRAVGENAVLAPSAIDPSVDRDLSTICLKCLEKVPERRYRSPREVADDLRRRHRGEPITARRVGVLEQGCRWASRHRPIVAAATVAIAVAFAGLAMIAWKSSQVVKARRDWELAKVETLLTAKPSNVNTIIDDLTPFYEDIVPRLHELLRSPKLGEARRSRLRVALARGDESLLDSLADQLLQADPDELSIIRHALARRGGRFRERFWRIVESVDEPRERRFRAAAALAEIDPGADAKWAENRDFIASHLARIKPYSVGPWLALFEPARMKLLDPLKRVFVDQSRSADEKYTAALIVASLYADDPKIIDDLIQVAEPVQIGVLFGNLLRDDHPASAPVERTIEHWIAATPARRLALLTGKLEGNVDREADLLGVSLDPDLPAGQDRERAGAIAKRKVNAAIALLLLERPERVWTLFRLRPDPTVRTLLIERVGSSDVNPELLINRFRIEPDVSARRGLLLALGGFPPERMRASIFNRFVRELSSLYSIDPDPGIHSAIFWTFRRWGQAEKVDQADESLAKTSAAAIEPTRDWFVSPKGRKFAVVRGPVLFMMGSPADEPERGAGENRHRVSIPRTFAIATHETTIKEYTDVVKDYESAGATYTDPVTLVDRADAIRYCRLLSELEGIPESSMCYRADVDPATNELIPYPDYLMRTGYRLPTEAEWECACRAGAESIYFMGNDSTMLPAYAWLREKATAPHGVALLKPNDLGLFDMLGNVSEWCQNGHPYPADFDSREIVEDLGRPLADGRQVFRGSSVMSTMRYSRVSARYLTLPHRSWAIGFRIARTIAAHRPEVKAENAHAGSASGSQSH